ncbi:MAG: type III pantothenate kinase [Lachnospiraceae bacterium]|nr:type III pantothenate kinase [Lachnospiraceae bacterium]
MILGIDVGNTHITFGCIDDGKVLKPLLRIPTDRKETEYGFAIKFKEILGLSQIKPSDLDGAVISSVVPVVTSLLKKAVELIADVEVLVVGPGIKTGIKIGIDDPGTLGADLVSTAVAAAEKYPLPCIIIDMGTATTVTVLGEGKEFKGGAIYPGLGTSLNALTQGTSLLPAIEVSVPKNAVAKNTVDCIRSGIVYGTAGAIDGIISALEDEMGKAASIVCTGGMGPMVSPYCKHELIDDEELLLNGLDIIWKKNR